MKKKNKKKEHRFFYNDEDRRDFYIAIPVLLLAGIFILSFLGKNDLTEAIGLKKEVPILKSRIITEWGMPEANDVEEGYVEVEEVYVESEEITLVNSKEDESQVSQIKKRIESELEVIQSSSILATSKQSMEEEIVEEEIIEEAPLETIIIEEEEIAEEENIIEEQEIEVIENPMDCSIAVGLYKETKNLNEMLNRLQSNGYKAYMHNLYNSTKVAVKIPCDPNEAQKVLKEIQFSFASDAYIEQ